VNLLEEFKKQRFWALEKNQRPVGVGRIEK